MVDADIPEEVCTSHVGPFEDCLLHDGRRHLGGYQDQLKGEIGEISLGLLPEPALKFYLMFFGNILGVSHLGLPHKHAGLLLGPLKQPIILLPDMLNIHLHHHFLRVMGADQCLQIHQAVPHVLMLGFEEILDLDESEQLRDIVSVLGSYDALSLCVLLEVLLSLTFISHLRMMQQEAL